MSHELHFEQELARLRESLLRMSSLAEQSLSNALKALERRDAALAATVDAGDDLLDRLQMEIDEQCIRLMALRQPMARDLRLIVMSMKMAAEMERIGDQAVNIAHRAAGLDAATRTPPAIGQMGERVWSMMRSALDAFVESDSARARAVIREDDAVDRLNREVHQELTVAISSHPERIFGVLSLMSVAHNLERIGDHAVNMAEEIIYLLEARDIRHAGA